MEEGGAEKLMNTLISKMESMDTEVQILKAENASLRRMMKNPQNLLRKAGFVQYATPYSEDVEVDAFRADIQTGDIRKGEAGKDMDTYTNEQVHEMTWDEIHDMADQHREVKEMY
tara:strand:- start:187 stop:531 length:345 start_codon:yes stop_codon:yes gene_type:complete